MDNTEPPGRRTTTSKSKSNAAGIMRCTRSAGNKYQAAFHGMLIVGM